MRIEDKDASVEQVTETMLPFKGFSIVYFDLLVFSKFSEKK